jgi:hypothetical protein
LPCSITPLDVGVKRRKERIMPIDKEKSKILDQTLNQIEKQFGKGAIMRLGEESHLMEQGVIRRVP